MADTVAHAKVVYTGDDKGLNKASKRVNANTAKTIRNFKRLGVAAAAMTIAFAAMAKRALDSAEALSDMANKANAGVEGLQELRFAATQNGASMRDMDDALSRLNRRMSLFASDGGGPAAKAIEALSLNIKDADGNLRASDEVFVEIATKFEGLATNAEKAALASQLLGEDAGPRLLALLNQGAAGLIEYAKRGRELGLVLDEVGVRKAAAVNAKLRALSDSMKSGITRTVIENIEVIEDLADTMVNDWIPAIGKITTALTPFVTALGRTLSLLTDIQNAWGALAPEITGGGENPEVLSPDKVHRAPYTPTKPRLIDPKTGEPFDMRGGGRGSLGMTEGFNYEDALERQMSYYNSRQEAIKRANEKELDLARQGGTAVAEVEEGFWFERVETMGGFLDQMAARTTGNHQKMFKALAAVAGKEGLINTYLGATAVLKDTTVPIWAKAAAVGAILSSGMSLVNSIQSVSGTSAGGASAGGSVAPQAPAGGGGQFINLNLVGDMFGREAVLGLIGQFNEAIEDGAVLSGVRAT